MQREEQRRRSRAAILDAAGAQFERHGYAATSLSDVAAELGMVRGTVHFHFATKDGLVEALAAHFDEVWTSLAREALGTAATPREGLVAFSHRLADVMASDAKMRGAVRIGLERPGGVHDLTALAPRWLALVGSTLKGQNKAARSELVTATMMGLLELDRLGLATKIHERIDAAWATLPD